MTRQEDVVVLRTWRITKVVATLRSLERQLLAPALETLASELEEMVREAEGVSQGDAKAGVLVRRRGDYFREGRAGRDAAHDSGV